VTSPGQAQIVRATSTAQVADGAALFREYAASLPFSLAFQGFDAELAGLPGRYAEPRGVILVAYAAGVGGEGIGESTASRGSTIPVACIALRQVIDETTCEMKRMYVRPSHRGIGLGRRLAVELIEFARGAGYTRMVLDTEPDFAAAVGLYRSLGFMDTFRYNDDPNPQTLFMERGI
jgi:GNAT superfamily N-acetyltransferase